MSVYIPPRARALDVWRFIQGKPSSVVFSKANGTTLAAQTLRLEHMRSQEVVSAAGEAARYTLVLVGVRDHPTEPDAVVARGYRFYYEGKLYTVLDPVLHPGEVQAEVQAV